jgi:hypothetical protein
MSGKIKTRLVALFVAISLCVTWFLWTYSNANGNSNGTLTPFVFSADSHIHNRYDQLPNVWRMRIASNWLAGRLCDAFAQGSTLTDPVYKNLFGFYNAAWLFLTLGLIICLVDNCLFVIALVFAGMGYALTPPTQVTIFPWDMPSMFFWTLSFLLWQRGKYLWLLAAIVLGTAFKETVAVLAVLFFFSNLAWRKRGMFFSVVFICCLLLKLDIATAILGHPVIFTADSAGHVSTTVFKDLFTPHLNHFIWVNGGTFILALFLPIHSLLDKGSKAVLLLFLAGMFLACLLADTIFEFRQFLDVLPISVLYLDRTVQRWRASEKEPGQPQL